MATAPQIARVPGTTTTYKVEEIKEVAKLAKMRSSLLVDDADRDVVLIPVNHATAPHFRRVGSGYERRIDRADNDPTHNACVQELFDTVGGRQVKIHTYWFNRDPKKPNAPATKERQLIASLNGEPDYKWWKEARVPVGMGEYIQPDLMGRDTTVFTSKANARGVIIEVIQTHYPDEATFFKLLQISSLGFLVIFYFIAPDQTRSKYNQFYVNGVTEQHVALYVTYYLLDGAVWANAERRNQGSRSEKQWYAHLEETYFKTPMAEKNTKKAENEA